MTMESSVGLMATKLRMTTYFDSEAAAADVVQLYRRVRDRKLTKPQLGHLAKAGAALVRHLRGFRVPFVEGFEPWQRLVADDTFEGDGVGVARKSIRKGFQGHIKRHSFRRGPMTHGSKSQRALGSTGAGTTRGRVC